MGLKNEFETAVVNEPSVFEPLKFYCIQFPFTMTKINYFIFELGHLIHLPYQDSGILRQKGCQPIPLLSK